MMFYLYFMQQSFLVGHLYKRRTFKMGSLVNTKQAWKFDENAQFNVGFSHNQNCGKAFP